MSETVLAIDIGATWIRAGVIDRSGRILERSRVETGGESQYSFEKSVIEAVESLSRDLVREVVGVGVGSIGPMDIKRGVISPPNIRAKNIDLKRIFYRVGGGRPVYLANDCVAAVIGEYIFGEGRGFQNIVYITISTGIGAGVIVDGQPLVGKDGNAHEIGHLVVDWRSGIKCGCGGLGHWEALCSGSGMVRLAGHLYRSSEEYRGSVLSQKILSGSLSSRDIYEAASRGDRLAERVVEECNEIHAAGVASVVNAYDPEIVFFGGSVVLNNSWIVEEIGRRVDKYITNRKPLMRVTEFGDDVVLVGAGALVLGDYPKKDMFRIL